MVFLPFFIWHKKKLVKIHPEEVMLLETVGNYTRIFVTDQPYFEVRSSLATALKKLPEDIFIKVHRRYIVSIFYIRFICRDHLIVGEKTSVPIGRLYYKPLVERLNVME
jgi:DNA-binding LytR/AlgR family response regulator